MSSDEFSISSQETRIDLAPIRGSRARRYHPYARGQGRPEALRSREGGAQGRDSPLPRARDLSGEDRHEESKVLRCDEEQRRLPWELPGSEERKEVGGLLYERRELQGALALLDLGQLLQGQERPGRMGFISAREELERRLLADSLATTVPYTAETDSDGETLQLDSDRGSGHGQDEMDGDRVCGCENLQESRH